MRRCLPCTGAVVLALLVLGSCARRGTDDAAEYAPVIEPADFVATVDNTYFPLLPSTTYLYQTPDATERVEVHSSAGSARRAAPRPFVAA